MTHQRTGCLKKSLATAPLSREQRREIVRKLAAAYPVQTLCEDYRQEMANALSRHASEDVVNSCKTEQDESGAES